jgi:hypothetical protein
MSSNSPDSKQSVLPQVICPECHRTLKNLRLDCSDDGLVLLVICPFCEYEGARVLRREIGLVSTLPYERFLYELESFIRISPAVKSPRVAKELRRTAVLALARVLLTEEYIHQVVHEAFNRRSRRELQSSIQKGER